MRRNSAHSPADLFLTGNRWLLIALTNLAIAALLGALLRFTFIQSVSWVNFRYFVHAHSHVALLGWAYQGLFATLLVVFKKPFLVHFRTYRTLFWTGQTAVIGMLFTFPLHGYAAWSIFFSTLHLLSAYVFVIRFWRDLPDDRSVSRRFIRGAIVFFLISSVGLWAMPPIMINGLQDTAWYTLAVQWYLHFQFHGWLLFGLLAVFIRYAEQRGYDFSALPTRRFFTLLVAGTIFTWALVPAWLQYGDWTYWLYGAGAIVKFIAVGLLLKIIIKIRKDAFRVVSASWGVGLIVLALTALVVSVLLQALLAYQPLAMAVSDAHHLIIGYLHLVLLGIVSMSLIGINLRLRLFSARTVLAKAGLFFFAVGFFLTEIIIFLQRELLLAGLSAADYYSILFFMTLLFPIGLILFWVAQLRRVKGQSRRGSARGSRGAE